MGFPCTYLQAVVISLATHGGIGSINLRIEQGIMIVTEIMRILRTPGHGQDILQIFFRTFQHALGLSQLLLEYPNQRAPHLKGHYYVYLRNFLSEHKMQLECACVTHPKFERENDIFLMDAACAKSKVDLSDPNIRTVNYCRSYLEIKCLSDICTADDHYILPLVMEGQRSVTQSQSRLEEIIQERPEKKEWSVWRKFLRQYCHKESTRLIKSLGKRTTTIPSSKRLWTFYFSSKDTILYQGYREDWHDNIKYQFDEYECNDEDVFDFIPEDRNIKLKYIPDDTIPVDVADAQ